MSDDPFDLQRFVAAQAPVIDTVRAELAAGRKQSHWMWFVFPQIAGLGFSPTAVHYAISSADEAAAFLAHPVLGVRLRETTELANRASERSAREVFGSPDDLKFRSSMTLFDRIAPGEVFAEALQRYFDGAPDPLTLERLGDATPSGPAAQRAPAAGAERVEGGVRPRRAGLLGWLGLRSARGRGG